MKRKKPRRRWIALLLALCMVMGTMTTALAGESSPAESSAEETQESSPAASISAKPCKKRKKSARPF